MTPHRPLLVGDMEHTLDAFQHEVLEFMDASGGRCIYADPVGARKTATTLTWLSQQADLPRTLVVAPKAVHGHWGRECARWFPAADFLAAGKNKESRHIGYSLIQHADEPVVAITTYEAMKIDEKQIIQADFHTIVFDEGHRLKGRRTGVALTANAITRDADCLLLVTGTPIMNSADEMWQYLHMLDRKTYSSFVRWTDEHFVIETAYFRGRSFPPTRVIHDMKPSHVKIVQQQFSKWKIQRPIEELFAGEAWVEPAEHVVVPVVMTSSERKAYDKLVKFGWSVVGKEVITTDNKVAHNTRLQQLSSDWGTLDSSLDDGAKVVAAAELIGDLARRETVVAFTSYKATAHRLVARLDKLGLRARTYTGDDDREAVLEDYERCLVDVVVGTLAALGTGVDGLQRRGSSIVMLDRGWTPAINEQAIGRRRRSGQRERVSVYHVFNEGTIDVAVVKACLDKANVIEVLDGRPLKDSIYGKGFTL
jgi:SNF2 family DNA or RNA helicase